MFEPRAVCVLCEWCTSTGADLDDTSHTEYPHTGITILRHELAEYQRSKGHQRLDVRPFRPVKETLQ
jgi:hypothetical protein